MSDQAAQQRRATLTAFAAGGSDLDDLPREDMTTAPEVEALLAALTALRERITTDERLWTGGWRSPLGALAGQVQNFDHQALAQPTGEVPDALWDCVNRLADVCQTLTEALPSAAPGTTFGTERDLGIACKVLAMYGHPRLPKFLRGIAPYPAFHSDYLWEVMFRAVINSSADKPEKLEALLGSLQDPLPTDFLLIAYLDFANTLGHNLGWYKGESQIHPFNTDQGEAKLRALLQDPDPEHYSYAHSGTAALLFLDAPRRERLMSLATAHPSKTVQLEAAFAQASLGDQQAVQHMAFLVGDDEVGERAHAYLTTLGRLDAIQPEDQTPEAHVRREILSWLAHPNEFGRPPTTLEVQRPVRLHWPPTNDERDLYVFRYAYQDNSTAEGQGVAGSVLFALRSPTAHLSAPDMLALHCSWEMAQQEGMETWSVEDGTQRLAAYNKEFQPKKGFLRRLFRA